MRQDLGVRFVEQGQNITLERLPVQLGRRRAQYIHLEYDAWQMGFAKSSVVIDVPHIRRHPVQDTCVQRGIGPAIRVVRHGGPWVVAGDFLQQCIERRELDQLFGIKRAVEYVRAGTCIRWPEQEHIGNDMGLVRYIGFECQVPEHDRLTRYAPCWRLWLHDRRDTTIAGVREA
ncbi:hypothetical protein D3C76_1050520 [compost metagenome]